MRVCVCVCQSPCARARAERVQGKPPASKYPKSSSFTRGPRLAAGWGRGFARELGGRGRLCRAGAAHAPRSRARPPAPQPRARRGPTLLAPRRGGSRFPPAPRAPGGWGLGASQRGCRRKRAEQAAGGGGIGGGGAGGGGGGGSSARSSRSERGHVHRAPPGRAANRGEARRFCGAAPGRGPAQGRPRRAPPPSAPARPNYLRPSSLRPPPPPPPFSRRALRTAPARGARVGAPAWAPGRPGCEGIFHSFLSPAQSGSVLLPLGGSRGLKSPQRAPKYLFQGGFSRGVYVGAGGMRDLPKGRKEDLFKIIKRSRGAVAVV